jgi:hypothetical protein
MWRVGAAASILLLIVLATQFRPHHEAEARPLGASALRACARQVLNHWVVDGRILDGYRRECYEGVLDMIANANPDALYGASVFSDVQEKLRTTR